MHAAIRGGLVRACHDLSEGGIAVAAAEMAFAGGLGAKLSLVGVPNQLESTDDADRETALLFSESNTRFLCEVPRGKQADFERTVAGVPHAQIGEVTASPRLQITGLQGRVVIDADIAELKESWQVPLRW